MPLRSRLVLAGFGVVILAILGLGLALSRPDPPQTFPMLTLSMFAVLLVGIGLRRSSKPNLVLGIAAVLSLLCACVWFLSIV